MKILPKGIFNVIFVTYVCQTTLFGRGGGLGFGFISPPTLLLFNILISTYFNHPIFVYKFLGIQFQYPILIKKFS